VIVSLIAALSAENRGIGWQGSLPWHQPKDLQRFRRLTTGHALIFGRKTYDSLGGRKLPGRRLIVLTRRGLPAKGVRTAPSLEAALELAVKVLAEGGGFVAKILQGSGEKAFVHAVRARFRAVHYVKPTASRKESAETYIVALGFRGPPPAAAASS